MASKGGAGGAKKFYHTTSQQAYYMKPSEAKTVSLDAGAPPPSVSERDRPRIAIVSTRVGVCFVKSRRRRGCGREASAGLLGMSTSRPRRQSEFRLHPRYERSPAAEGSKRIPPPSTLRAVACGRGVKANSVSIHVTSGRPQALMTKRPLDLEQWLCYHRSVIGVERFYIQVEDTPELAALLLRPPWNAYARPRRNLLASADSRRRGRGAAATRRSFS